MKKGSWIVIGLALMAAVMCACAPTGDQERPATVIEVVNQVDAHPRAKDDWQPAEVDMVIYGGGQVRTGAASSAHLELLEGVVRLSAESLFTVKESTTRQEKLQTTLFLQEGRLWAHLTSDRPLEFTVETGNAVAAVRDTHFTVKGGPGQKTLVSVAKGEVVLTAQGQSVTVAAGQQATVEPGQPPAPPEPMSDGERALWTTEGESEKWNIELIDLVLPTATPTPPTSTPTPAVRVIGPPPGPARSGEAPYTAVDPTIDGMATSFEEWAQAFHYPNEFSDGAYSNAGYFYAQNKDDWKATSSRGNSATLPGVTFFLAHDIWGQPDGLLHMFRTPGDEHWNMAEITLPGGNIVECWILAFGDAMDDLGWLSASGLENSSLIPEGSDNNLINDVGFIVRLNRDPATDRHWFPGDPEPGDPEWNDDEYYGCFGMWGFNNSFQATGLDPDPAHSDENVVYEWKFVGVLEDWLLQCQEIKIKIVDPLKYWIVFIAPDWWIHLLPPSPPPSPTPTHTPTPEPEKVATLTPTPTPTEAPPAEPQDVAFEAEDGQELVGTYYPPPACPSPLTVVYYPWVRGDKDDFYAVAALLPEDVSYGALAITPRGCEGGCGQWDLSGWALDYVAALSAAKGLPCAEQSPIVTIGSSVGGDGAVYACGQEEDCVGALSFSAGDYLDEPFADLVATMVEQGKHVWSVSAQDDPGSVRLDRPEWGDYYREIVLPGDKHGNQLFDASTGEIIHSFIECATHSFGSEECVAALTEEYVAGCNAYLAQGGPMLVAHEETGVGDCALAIDLLQSAIQQATAALELDCPDCPERDAVYFCRGMSRRWLEEGLNEAIEDLQRALDLGLEGDKRAEAETELERLRDKVAAPICVTMQTPRFAQDWRWDEGVAVNEGTTFPANSTREVWARWTLSNPCDGEEMVVKWYHDKKLKCQHYDKLEAGWDYSGSGWTADEEWIEVGQWCVKVLKGDTLLTEACFTIK